MELGTISFKKCLNILLNPGRGNETRYLTVSKNIAAKNEITTHERTLLLKRYRTSRETVTAIRA